MSDRIPFHNHLSTRFRGSGFLGLARYRHRFGFDLPQGTPDMTEPAFSLSLHVCTADLLACLLARLLTSYIHRLGSPCLLWLLSVDIASYALQVWAFSSIAVVSKLSFLKTRLKVMEGTSERGEWTEQDLPCIDEGEMGSARL